MIKFFKQFPGFIMREFRIEDYDALMSLWREAELSHKPKGRDSREKLALEINMPTSLFLIAEVDGKIIGSVFGTHEGRKGWINRLAVSPDYRGRGIAKKLLVEIEKIMNLSGIDITACLIEDWNSVSINFFEKMGYIKMTGITYFSKRKHKDV